MTGPHPPRAALASDAPSPQEPRLDFVTCTSPAGAHRMAYWEWGDPDNPRVLVCVHGLTRCGRDFDTLARHLSAHYRIVCPDIVGRGQSDWLVQAQHYTVAQYVADMLVLIARLNVTRLDWVGTSMGGLIGLGLAGLLATADAAQPTRDAQGLSPPGRSRHIVPSPPTPLPHVGEGSNSLCPPLAVHHEGATVSDSPSPVRGRGVGERVHLGKMVLNDIGPNIDTTGLVRIAEYVGQPVVCHCFAQAVDAVRQTAASFGPHSQAQWEALTRHVFVQTGDVWVKHYDLRMAEALQATQDADALRAGEALLWAAYESLTQPVLIMRGQASDLLTAQTAQEMLRRNAQAQLYEVAGVGHAPSLMQADQVQRIADFLLDDAHDTHAAHPAARTAPPAA